MDIQKLESNIRLDEKEISIIVYSIKRSLLGSVKAHYKYHQHVFQDHESIKLNLLEKFSGLIGRIDIYRDTMREVNDIFEEENSRESRK